ncbi:hypothetical protein BK120_30545 [Paenibacillus sp. FSL A5-0031]|uniref:helix-turn-helix domain-containing protein n=1 Tax=Paenibacillus sp. FSL A5-0031 TaxID=1920420 RepID=UPI00096CA880|nr:AraC family transcriptional regulator [Paenibacillus sp. FSL A5-0031]OME75819.1 hypothetical protein BK120_30545 [Paenibacillus sp. FSL A5-0031]
MLNTNQYLLRGAKSILLKKTEMSNEMLISTPSLFMLGEGYGAMKMDDDAYELSFGCLLFAHAGTRASISSSEHSDLHLYMIQFDQYVQIQDTRDQLVYHQSCEGLPDNGYIASNRIGILLGLFKSLIEAHQAEASSNPFEAQKLLLELLYEVLIAGHKTPYYDYATPVQKAVQYIKENYSTKLQRNFLAHLTGYHPHYLSKQFNKEMGQSISDFILQLRVDKAKELLSITSSHINEIAAIVGYQDALYFSRKFKQATGMHPSNFRQRPKRIVAFQFIGTLLALGITPVGVDARLAYHSQQLRSELEGVISFEDWDSQKVRMLQPDIIVAPDYLRPEQLGQLRTIAPVLVQPWENINPIERLRFMGHIFGIQHEAEKWILQFYQMAEQLKYRLSNVFHSNETAAVYEIADGNIYVLSKQDRGAYALYDVLGFQPPDAVKEHVLDAGKSKIVTLDELSLFAADHMIISIFEETGMEKTNRLLASEAWQQLPAVKSDLVYRIPVNKCYSNDGVSLQKLTFTLAQLFL